MIVRVLEDRAFLPDGGDVVVEWGNARYQDVVDTFVAGGSVAHDALRRVWREAVNILVWDAPVYERLFETVRSVNRGRSPAHRLRVILADPPIEWSAIRDNPAWEAVAASRDRFAADVIEREVFARGRRALLIFGSGHVDYERAFDRSASNLAELLRDRHPGAMLSVTTDWMTPEVERRLSAWHPPALVRLDGNGLGDVRVAPPGSGLQLKELADAFLFLGRTSLLTSSTPPLEIYRDRAYMQELLRRDAIQGGANTAELQRLAKLVTR